MNRNKNYRSYWVWIPFAIITGLFFNKPVEILLHDFYFITSRIHISILISVILFVSGLGYFLYRNRELNEKLTKAHNWITIAGLFVILFFVSLEYYVNKDIHSGEFVEYQNIERSIQIAVAQLIGIALLGLGFLCYLLNLTITTFKLITK